jgi:hypothetical protein
MPRCEHRNNPIKPTKFKKPSNTVKLRKGVQVATSDLTDNPRKKYLEISRDYPFKPAEFPTRTENSLSNPIGTVPYRTGTVFGNNIKSANTRVPW